MGFSIIVFLKEEVFLASQISSVSFLPERLIVRMNKIFLTDKQLGKLNFGKYLKTQVFRFSSNVDSFELHTLRPTFLKCFLNNKIWFEIGGELMFIQKNCCQDSTWPSLAQVRQTNLLFQLLLFSGVL